MAGAKPDQRRPAAARGHRRAADHMVAAGAAVGRVADFPWPCGVQHAERLLFTARVAGAHRRDRHQHLVYGQANGWAEGRAVRTQPLTRQVRVPNQLGADSFRRHPDGRWSSGRRRCDLRHVHRTSDARRRLQGHRNLHRGLDRGADRANLRRRAREDPRLRAVSTTDTRSAAGLVQPHPVLQAGQGISGSPRRIGFGAQRRQLGTADGVPVFDRDRRRHHHRLHAACRRSTRSCVAAAPGFLSRVRVRLADKVSAEFFRRLLAGRGFDVESASNSHSFTARRK